MSIRKPSRGDIERIVKEEAAKLSVDWEDVVSPSIVRRVAEARHRAIRRIYRETGCSQMGLANAWGCSGTTVSAALSGGGPPEPRDYDWRTAERLRWRYGEARAAQIIAGQDPNTIADLAAWRRVGSRPEAKRSGL